MRPVAAACIALLALGCAGSPPPQAPAAETAADQEPAAAPGYAQPPPMTPEAPSTLEEPVDEERKIETVEQGEQALREDQQRLDELLAQPLASATDAACRRVCTALGSMRRSADAICRLAGDGETRCRDARDTVSRNEERVANAGCRC